MTLTPDTFAAAFDAMAPQQNPHAVTAIRHVNDWVAAQGLVVREAARDRFARADFGAFAALVYPTADAAALDLTADWFAWFFLLDDQLDDGVIGHAPERLAALMASILDVVGDRPIEPDAPMIVRALADLWERTTPVTGPVWRRRFIDHATRCALAAVWEADNRVHATVPSDAEYVTQRRHTGAIYPCMDLIEIVERIELPDGVYTGELFTRALDAACDVVCWTNDVFSVDKETALGEYHNLVSLHEHWDRMSRTAALETTMTRIVARLAEFTELQPRVLAAWPGHAEELAGYLAGMRSWMRGNLDWSAETRRYRDALGGNDTPAQYLESALVDAVAGRKVGR
ncbi:terpene synthase family protein [Nocardia nova]|uniref:terpene synthase family protein n=1 Tax=Nocardia nova TaxID=37330 RepID=UPI0033F74923